MKKNKLLWITGVLLVFALIFAGCSSSSDDTPRFEAETDTSLNADAATLGFTGTSAISDNPAVATAAISSGKVAITSVSPGTVNITVLDSSYNEVTIKVTVKADGSITIAAKDIVKYDPADAPSFPAESPEESLDNTEAVLGLTGDSVAVDPTGAISAAIENGKIKITASASGAAVITVNAADIAAKPGHKAVIDVVVTAAGKIITSITKYEAPSPKGRTYIDWNAKIVFGTAGEVTVYGTFYDESADSYVLAGGKFKYWPMLTGTYTYNATAKTVTFTPTKVADPLDEDDDGYPGYTDLLTRSQSQTMYTPWWNSRSAEEKEEFKQEEFPSQSFNEALKEMLDEEFAPRIYTYSFSLDESVLFLAESLPANRGANELNGKTFAIGWYNNGEWQEDTSRTVEFTSADEYKVEYSGGGGTPVQETGHYAYDTSNTSSEGKRVYLKPDKVAGWLSPGLVTRSEFYEAIKDEDFSSGYQYGYFANDSEYKQVQTNASFELGSSRYTLSPNRVRGY
jgi:hypothetical protein